METSEDKPAKDDDKERAHLTNQISSGVNGFLLKAIKRPDLYKDTEKGVVIPPNDKLTLSLVEKLFPVPIKAFNIKCGQSRGVEADPEITQADYQALTDRIMTPTQINHQANPDPNESRVQLNLGDLVELTLIVFKNSPDTEIYIKDLATNTISKTGQYATLEELQLISSLLILAKNKRAARYTPDTRS